MGLPSIEIIFKMLGITAIRRSSRGVVALILEDAAHATIENPIVMRGVNDIPDTLDAVNQEQIELAFRGGINPAMRVMAYVIAPATELDPADYTEAQNYLETAMWDYLAVPHIAADKVDAMATWIKGLRDNKARKVKAVLPNCKADHEGIINFTTDNIVVGEKLYNTAQYCARIAGILAGNPLTIASTFQVLPEVEDVPHLTSDEFDTAIDAGELVLMHDGEKVKIARGVNSLTSFTADKGEEFSKIKLVDIMDLIHRDITRTAEDYYIGKMPNDYDHKVLLTTAINAYLKTLENEGLLDRGKNWVDVDAEAHRLYLEGRGLDTEGLNEQQLRQANTGAHVFLTGSAKPLDAMEDIKIQIFI